ncbi:hypothetical protein QBC32DRAFT_391914, partial [Pseudoneurospora amorphoporcata]
NVVEKFIIIIIIAAERDSLLPSVELEQSLVVYNVEDFDTIMINNTDITNGHVRVPNPPSWLVALHEQVAVAHNQIRGIPVAIGNKHTQELTTLKE